MSRQINTPVNQVKLTNVAVVRYNHGGNRFEIACYRNKVMDYRAGLETDLTEVLQTDRIFTNVSKGQFAATADLQVAFGTTDEEAIAKMILEKGSSLQISDLERQQMFEQTLQQIAVWVASNCVHPDSGRPYTVSQIRHALGKNYAVQPHKAIKKQYLDAVKFLKTGLIDIERAKMELSLQYPASAQSSVTAALEKLEHRIVSTTTTTTSSTTATGAKIPDAGSETTVLVLHVDPSLYRDLNEISKQVTGGRMEIVQQVVAQEGDVNLDQEIERKKQQLAQKQQDTQSQTANATESSSHKNSKNHDHDDDSDESDEDAPLVQKLAAVRLQVHEEEEEHHEGPEDASDNSSDDDDDLAQNTRRQNQKKNQKKSKKAKRREKEETIERQARIDAEKKRKEDRFDSGTGVKMTASIANAEHQQQQSTSSVSSTSKSCNTCGGSFANAAEYRAHFRSDWHRFNQKLKLKSIPPVSEQEFLICDAETFFG